MVTKYMYRGRFQDFMLFELKVVDHGIVLYRRNTANSGELTLLGNQGSR